MRIEIINPQLLARLLMVFGLLVFTNALAGTKDFALHQAVLDDDKQLVTQLLNKGAAINVIGSRKYGYGSALHVAVREGHLEIANLLLKRGAEVDVLDPDDFTPLHNAAWNGNLEMTELLLDAGADIEASTYDGDTPLSLAQNNNQPKVAEFIQAKLLASPVVDTTVGSTPVSDPGAINISGTYISEITYPTHGDNYAVSYVKEKNRKEITLEQTGNAISGFDGTKDPKIIGTRDGNTINFHVLIPSQISGTWEINADGTEMVGKWSVSGRGLYGTWKLTKIESTAASDSGVRDVSGTYVMTNLTGTQWLVALFVSKPKITIAQNGDQLTGKYDGGREQLWGEIKGDTIKFDWAVIPNTGQGKWTFKPGSNESSVSLSAHSGAGEVEFNLTKIESDVDQIPDISGTYISEITGDSRRLPSKEPNPEVRLVQNGNEITGSFESNGKIWGEIEGDTIKFDFLSPRGGTGRGKWTIKPGSNEITGHWSETHRGSGKWNLTKIE